MSIRTLALVSVALAVGACNSAPPGLACLYSPTAPSGPPMSCAVLTSGITSCPSPGSSDAIVAQVASCPTMDLVGTCSRSSGGSSYVTYVYAPVPLDLARMGCLGTFVPAAIGGDAGSDDPCASSTSPSDTVGCNGGFASGTPAPNTPAGVCSGTSTSAQGTCEAPGVCGGVSGSDQGYCYPSCTPGPGIISTGGCPMGFRCQRLDPGTNICWRDCDATHPCPPGMDCNSDRCIGPL